MTQPTKRTTEHGRLDAFVGPWNTEGEILNDPSGSPVRFRATDTYELVAGGFFLLHRFNAEMPGGETTGIEVIGYSAERRTYSMRSFDNHGNVSDMEARVDGDSWTFTGKSARFAGGFRNGGKTFAGMWELRPDDDAVWQPWMRVTLQWAERP